ncbi:MCE family protein [Actinomadura flavalba]|uniref:MCE family protein n=1 Tax=Actinomadura flavalba TaxID=1120938 RepID=UPI0003A2E4B6|nr:MCE family protein [Actinomadura flavalba]
MRHRSRNDGGVLLRRSAGVVFILVPALLIWLSVAIYDKKFTSVAWVTVKTASVGNEMHRHADVKMRGVVIGEVRDIQADGNGATLKLALQPDKLAMVPANVSAQMLPTTLFGARYVAFVPPAQPEPARLTADSVIGQDRSANAIELQRVLDNLLPLLTAVRPQQLSATLTAVSQALDGRGTDLGKTMVELDSYLKELNPNLPALNNGIRELVKFTETYSQATPDILDALNDLTRTSQTIVSQRQNLATMYSSLTRGSQDLTDFLRDNRANLIRVSAQSRASLETMARYAPMLPCTIGMINDFIPKMDQVLGKGTGQPGLHVNVKTLPSKGRYKPGKDAPKYGRGNGPHCPSVPYGAKAAPARAATASADAPVAVVPGGLGLPNSPQENRLVNELIAPGLQEVPEALPDWSSVLAGPVYRGTEVKVG